MIIRGLKPGRPIYKFATPIADFPNEHPFQYDYYYGIKRNPNHPSRYRFHYFPKQAPTFTNQLHFAIILESRAARTKGDSFPAFMRPFFESLGFHVETIENPKMHVMHTATQRAESFAYYYSNYHKNVSLQLNMPYAYDFSFMNSFKPILEEHPEVFSNSAFNYTNIHNLYSKLFPVGSAVFENRWTEDSALHMVYEGQIHPKRHMENYLRNPMIAYDMPQIKVVGARCVLISPHLYDMMDVPDVVSSQVDATIGDELKAQMDEFWTSPLSFESTNQSCIIRLVASHIQLPNALTPTSAGAEEVFYTRFLRIMRERYMLSAGTAYNELLSNATYAKRQPTNIFYWFRRPNLAFFTSVEKAPLPLLQSSK